MPSNECLYDVTCSGKSSTCPIGSKEFFKPNLTSCNSGTQVCLNGLCSGSICEKYNMSQCYLEGDLKNKNQDKSVLCHLACTGGKIFFPI
jgi:disintegrin and metalloproteinase domain-containing protein 10